MSRLIDADALKPSYVVTSTTTNSLCHLYVSIENINSAPTVDAVPVVRCGECRYWDRSPSCSATPQYHACQRRIFVKAHTKRDDFCSLGERKGGDENG